MTSNELEIFKQSILDDVRVMMQTTGQVTQYIGARYVPLFAEPLDWNLNNEYEPLTIVLHQGNSFTSRQFVPRGIDISNTEFWAKTGNYNAQIEQYRQEVQSKAPINHASETSKYGVGTSNYFGHLKLTDNDSPYNSDSNAGIATTPSYVNSMLNRINGSRFESIDAAIAYGVENNKVITYPILNISTPITIPDNCAIEIGTLNYDGQDYALILDGVKNTLVQIGSIKALNGSAVRIDCTNNTFQQNHFSFNTIVAKNYGIDLHSTSLLSTVGIMDSTFIGSYIKCSNPINVVTDGGWIGQLKIYVNRLEGSDTAIILNASKNGLNSIDFGYTSFEQSKNGLELIANPGGNGFEGIYGNFRAREVTGKKLIVSGSINKFRTAPSLTFDQISQSTIDVSEITQSEYSYGCIIINGFIFDPEWRAYIRTAVICDNNGMSPIDIPFQTTTVSANYNKDSFSPIYINGDNLEITIPNWVNAFSAPFIIECPQGKQFTLKNKNGSTVTSYDGAKDAIIKVYGQFSGNNNYAVIVENALRLRG